MNNVMTYKGYTASMSYDPDDKILVGRVLDIADIIAFHGESVAEFEAAFHASIDDYIEACAKLGQSTEKPASGKLMLRVDPSVHAAALKAAARAGQSMNKWAARVLADAVARH
jgi:predicted HicB family RNase H-like nuclease